MSFTDLSLQVLEEFAGLEVFDRHSLQALGGDTTAVNSRRTTTRKTERRNARLTHLHTEALLTPSQRRAAGLARGMTPGEYWRWYVENAIKANPERLAYERAKGRRHQAAARARLNLAAGRPLTAKQRAALRGDR